MGERQEARRVKRRKKGMKDEREGGRRTEEKRDEWISLDL